MGLFLFLQTRINTDTMKRILITISAWCFLMAAHAQTVQVSGRQSGVWEADTVLVTGDIDVEGSLEVLPGTLVLFDSYYMISVAEGAEFLALGTADDSIVFTVADTVGFFNEYSGRGGWNGFQIRKGRALLDYCVLEFGKAINGKDKEGGAMKIQGGDVEIAHSTLRCNFSCDRGGAIHAEDATLKMVSCKVSHNSVFTDEGTFAMYGGGISLLRSRVDLRDMEFLGNYGPTCIGGALSLDSCKVDLHNAVFADNVGLNGGGLYMMRNNHYVNTLYNVAFYGNYSGHFAGGLAFADSSPNVYNLLVTDNSSEGVNCNGVFFYGHSQPKMNNCIVYGNNPPYNSSVIDSVQMWVWTFDDYAPEFRNCLVQGGLKMITSGENIHIFEDVIDADPLFVDAENKDFRLQEGSPCRDAGHVFVPYDLMEEPDLGGLRRVSNNRIDMGPYEYSEASVPQLETGTTFARLIGNPLNEASRLVMELSYPQQVTVRVCSAKGTEMATMAFDGIAGYNEWTLNGLMKLVPGLYVVEVIAEEGVFALKAVK